MSIGPSNFPITPVREADAIRRVEPDPDVRDNARRDRQEREENARHAPVDEIELSAEALAAPAEPSAASVSNIEHASGLDIIA